MGVQGSPCPDKCHPQSFTSILFIPEPAASKPRPGLQSAHSINLRQFLQFLTHKEKFHWQNFPQFLPGKHQREEFSWIFCSSLIFLELFLSCLAHSVALEPLWQRSCCCCCVSEGFVGISCTVSKLFLEAFLGLSCADFPRILAELMLFPLSPFRHSTGLSACRGSVLCDGGKHGRNVSQDPPKPGLEVGPAKAVPSPSCPRVTVGTWLGRALSQGAALEQIQPGIH